MKLSIFLFTLAFPTLATAQEARGLEAETKFLTAIETGHAQIWALWEFPDSRDSSCDYIVKFREGSTSWVCYTHPSDDFCGEIRASRRFNQLIPVSKENFLTDYKKGVGKYSPFCFSPGPITYR